MLCLSVNIDKLSIIWKSDLSDKTEADSCHECTEIKTSSPTQNVVGWIQEKEHTELSTWSRASF